MSSQKIAHHFEIEHVIRIDSNVRYEAESTSPEICLVPRERKIRGSIPARGVGIFSGSSYTSDLKIGTPVATLPGAWRYRVRAGSGWPSVSIL